MSENTPGGGADATTATPTPEAGTTTSTAPVVAEVPASPSKGDWAGMVTSLREQTKRSQAIEGQLSALTETLAKLSPGKPATAAATPSDGGQALAAIEAMRFDLSLEKAFGAHKIAEDHPLRELIETAARAAKPPDLREYVGRYAKAAVTGASVTPPIAPSNTGAPAASPSGAQLPENPMLWPPDVVRKLGKEAVRKALDEYDANQGRGDPLRAVRRKRT
jgi:hypothetical protein